MPNTRRRTRCRPGSVSAPPSPERPVYRFTAAPPAWIRPGGRIVCRLGASTCSALVETVHDTQFELSFQADLGPTTAAGDVVPDDAWMLVALQESLRRCARLPASVAHILPVADVGPVPSPASVRPLGGWPSALDDLTEEQLDAVALTLGSPIALLCGPPGTGKTTTSSAGILMHVREIGRRVLLLAPTNRALDVALLRTAERLEADPRFASGLVLRVGDQVSPELRARFGDRVVLDEVVARVVAERTVAADVAHAEWTGECATLQDLEQRLRGGAATEFHQRLAAEVETLRTRTTDLRARALAARERAAAGEA